MNILYITCAKGLDYLSDCVFHGLVSQGEHAVTDSKYMWYLSQPLQEQARTKLYGKGFTISGLLPDRHTIDRSNLVQRIQDKEFDVVIYGSIHRCQDYLDTVLKSYPKNRIIFIDGQDAQEENGIGFVDRLLDKGIYFKRELKDTRALPISFSIPEEKILTSFPNKEKDVAFIIPGKKSTYIYNKQSDYYHDYAISRFGLTRKKWGWDCMRHYEIIGNHCLPYFRDFHKCPKYTMVNWPTQLQLQANRIYQTGDFSRYDAVLQEFFSYCKENLTTKKSAEYVLSKPY